MKFMTVYRLEGSRLHICMDGWSNIVGINIPETVDYTAPSITLDIANYNERQRVQGGVLYLDGQGMDAIIDHVARTTASPTPRRLYHAVCRIVGGRVWFRELMRATVRVGLGFTEAPGASDLWFRSAYAAIHRPTMMDMVAGRCEAVH